ncbi:MAG: hypothetical protein P8011_13780 [Acidihalobacter sp.]|jgi:hypothetical protein|uniref:hypothetical protein n=1 Tax=Acidihalobacter sp. TaxID=1872108 RepID=UPI00307D7C8F
MKSISSNHIRFVRVAGLLSLLAFIAMPLRAMAAQPVQPSAQTSAPNNGSANMRELQQKYMQVRGQLTQIEAKAIKSEPELIKKRQAFREQLIGVMKKNGDDPQKMIDSLKTIGQQMKDKKLSDSKRSELLGKARQTQMGLIAAERKAMQDPKLMAARKELRTATMAAMRKIDPKTDKLLGEMRSIEQQVIKAHSGAGQ